MAATGVSRDKATIEMRKRDVRSAKIALKKESPDSDYDVSDAIKEFGRGFNEDDIEAGELMRLNLNHYQAQCASHLIQRHGMKRSADNGFLGSSRRFCRIANSIERQLLMQGFPIR